MSEGPPPPSLLTDRSYLQSVAYADGDNLRARMSLNRFQVSVVPTRAWVLDLVDWPVRSRVLDVGCGAGDYLEALGRRVPVHAFGLDVSPGMAAESAAYAPCLVGDAEHLPFPDAMFDRVLAPLVLYHCRDVPRAIAELRRVLRPDGTLVAVTTSRAHHAEVHELRRAFGEQAPRRVSDRFDTANGGALLRASFASVALHEQHGEVRVPGAGPVLAYLRTIEGRPGRWTPDVTAEIERLVEDVIERDGAFRSATHLGAFVCT